MILGSALKKIRMWAMPMGFALKKILGSALKKTRPGLWGQIT
jgi:hypothetical protein